MSWRLSCLLIAAAPLLASNAFAQETTPPTTTPPATTPTAPDAPPPPPPASSPGVSAVPGPSQGELQGRRIPTSVDAGDKNAIIERRVNVQESMGRVLIAIPFHSDSETWEQVCVAPCRVDLDRYSSYRVARGNGLPATYEFTLPQGSDQLALKVEPGNLLTHRIASRLIGLGTAAAIVGGVLLTIAPKYDDKDEEKNVRLAGWITGGVGLLFLGIGIPLLLTSRTHVTSGDKKLANSAPKYPAPRLTANGLVF